MAWRVSGKGAGGFPARVAHALSRFHYTRLGTSDRCVARGFLSKATELSQAQMPRLVGQFTKSGHVLDGCGGAPRRPFERCHTAADIWPLAEADATAGTDGWTGDAQGHAVGVRGGRRHRLRAPGARLERTLLQPAPVHNQQAPAHRPATPRARGAGGSTSAPARPPRRSRSLATDDTPSMSDTAPPPQKAHVRQPGRCGTVGCTWTPCSWAGLHSSGFGCALEATRSGAACESSVRGVARHAHPRRGTMCV